MTHDEDFREDDGWAERIDALFDEIIADSMRESWCWKCQVEHQPRETAVPCTLCHKPTTDFHAICTCHRLTRANR